MSQEVQVKAANKHQKKAPGFQIDNMVWLLTKNIKTEKLSKKLDYKMIGSYQVKESVGWSYQLELLTSIKIHNMFHPNLL